MDLYLSISEAEINEILPRFLPPDLAVKNLRVRLTPQGLVLQGDYPTLLLSLSFEILWELAAVAGNAQAQLASLKVAGLPAGILRGLILSAIRDATAKSSAVKIENDLIRLDFKQLLKERKSILHIELKSLRTVAGSLILEAGPETKGPITSPG